MAKKPTETLPNSRIEHAVFGLGTIIERNERYTTITFDEGGTRKFLTHMVKLKPSSTPKPAKVPRKKKKKTAKKTATKSK